MKMKMHYLVIVTIFVSIIGCKKFLDVTPDSAITTDVVFSDRDRADNALATVYSYLPAIENTQGSMFIASDEYMGKESDLFDNTRMAGWKIMKGWQTSSLPIVSYWQAGLNGQDEIRGSNMYEGIRQANILINNVDNVEDLSASEKADWKAQATFLKAYFHFILVLYYGPVVIQDQNLSIDATDAELFPYRSTVDECFQYIINTIDESLSGLPNLRTRSSYGMVDKTVALSIKGRVLWMWASPFFNGNVSFYAGFLNEKGQPYFNQTYNKDRWKQAYDALDSAVKFCEMQGKGIYYYIDEGGVPIQSDMGAVDTSDALKNWYNIRMSITEPWNRELIWGRSHSRYWQDAIGFNAQLFPPSTYGSDNILNYDGVNMNWAENYISASYRMLERFYTKNGVPIKDDKTFTSDPLVTTTVPQDSLYENIMTPNVETLELYLNREPRFYANLAVTGGTWRFAELVIPLKMYWNSTGGGPTPDQENFFLTGIGLKKWSNPFSEMIQQPQVVLFPYPIIRMADLYLMRAEARNEYYGPSQEVYDDINKVRQRAAIPDVEVVWSDGNIVYNPGYHQTKEGLREIIYGERSVEFAFEGRRYFDMIRTKRAHVEFNNYIYGWNAQGTDASTFFVKTFVDGRTFNQRQYLFPLVLDELNKNAN